MKKLVRALYLFLALTLALSLGMIIDNELQLRRSAADTEQALRLTGLPQSGPARPDGPAPADPGDEPGTAGEEELPAPVQDLMGMDLEALREVNGDVVGWITIPDTELSFPLMQCGNNQYYLSRSWTGEKNAAGAIFLEAACDSALTGYHTIVYGHRMRDGSMFGLLQNYKEPDYCQEHPSVYLAVDEGIYRYDIFSAFEADLKGLVYRLDIEEKELESEFLLYCIDNSVIDTGVVPTGGEKILTLSTCTGFGHARRWVVQAVLRGEYPRERSLS